MSKQDRQGVRTPQDLERKYNLGSLGGGSGEESAQTRKLSQLLSQFMADTNNKIRELEDRLNVASKPSAETVILTGNLPSATGFSTTINYPDGFNQGNCYLSSFEVYFNNSWRCGTGLDADTTLRLFATLETSGVRAYTSGSPVYNAPFRVGITKL